MRCEYWELVEKVKRYIKLTTTEGNLTSGEYSEMVKIGRYIMSLPGPPKDDERRC